MKKLIYAFFLGFIVASCTQKPAEGFQITGKTLDVKTGDVYLLIRNPATWQADTLATTTLVDGNFILKGKTDLPKVSYIRFIADVQLKDSLGNPFSRKIAATDAIIIENKQINYESAVRGNGFLNHTITGDNLLYEKVSQPEKKIESLDISRKKYVALFEKASSQKIAGVPQDSINKILRDARMAYGSFMKERQEYQLTELNTSNDILYKALILNNFGIPKGYSSESVAKLQEELIVEYGKDNYHSLYIDALKTRKKVNKSVSVGNFYKNVSTTNLKGETVTLAPKLGKESMCY